MYEAVDMSRRDQGKWHLRYPVALLAVLSFSSQLLAGEWEVVKSVDVTTTHSDNIALANDANSESDTLLQVKPALKIAGQGARLQMDLDYSLSAIISDGDDNRDEFEDLHFLNANATLEAIENNLFIDFTANAGVSSISSSGIIPTDVFTRSTNRTQTYSFSVSPYLRYHFGQYADAILRVATDALSNQDGNTDDSDSTTWTIAVNSGDHFKDYSWLVQATQRQIDYDSGREDETSELNTKFSYRINRKFTADFGLGYEENDIGTTQYADTDGMTWDLGTTWTPNLRTTLVVNYGDRFYGDYWLMDLQYSHRKSLLKASYSTSVSNSRSEQIDSLSELDFDDNIFFDPNRTDQTLPTLGPEIIIQDKFKLAYQYKARRTTVKFDTSYIERDYQTSVETTEDLTGSISLTRELTPLTSLTTRLNWVNRENISTQSDEELFTFKIGMTSKIGANSKFSVNVQRSENEDSTGANDYEENRVSASLAMAF